MEGRLTGELESHQNPAAPLADTHTQVQQCITVGWSSLVGYNMGCRVTLYCILALLTRPERRKQPAAELIRSF